MAPRWASLVSMGVDEARKLFRVGRWPTVV